MDPTASNYDAAATNDDGNCAYDVFGCTDPTATNYNASATSDDGSCAYSSMLGCNPSGVCASAVDSGASGGSNGYYDSLIANSNFNAQFVDYYFEGDNNANDPDLGACECETTNGLQIHVIAEIRVMEYDMINNVDTILYAALTITGLITWLNANIGAGFNNTMGILAIQTLLQTYRPTIVGTYLAGISISQTTCNGC